jgi:hypothetical protein
MAHLVVSDLATALWEAISNNVSERDRPAFLDQTDGVSHSRTSNYDGLIAVADILKQDLDMTAFTVDRMGVEAMSAIEHIAPANAVFTDAVDLQSLFTTYVNLHDTLLSNLDCSGQGHEVGTVERRMNCFENFVGPRGRSKNLGLFYCFIAWEGKPTRWTTRRLDQSLVVSSVSSSTSVAPTNRPQTRKQKDSTQLVNSLREVFGTPTQQTTPVMSMDSVMSDGLLSEKKRLFEEKTDTERQTRRGLRSDQLQKAIESAGFQQLSDVQQQKIRDDWFASLLTDNSN